MRKVCDFGNILICLLICIRMEQNYAMAPIHLPIIDMIYQKMNHFNESIPDTNIFFEEYDFVIIGAGSGGSVVANRLSEIPSFTVLLIEAGEEENLISDVPLTPSVTLMTKYNWGYKSDPAEGACLGLRGGVCNWPKGRALGGSSVINFMLYQRGHRRDFDGWAENGNIGWSYDEVLPYFKKSERNGIPSLHNSPYHGHDGYLHVQQTGFRTKVLESFLQSAKEYGYVVNDPNGETLLGFSQTQANTRNGRRWSAAKAFLRSAQNRPNLFISKNSRATKILINPKTKIAYGVEFIKNRQKIRVLARKEVILSAGPISSPHLLMLSGVGPREHLEEFKIPVIQDLRVGFNLQDHSVVNGLDFTVNQPITMSESSVQQPRYMLEYFLKGSGPFTIHLNSMNCILAGGAEGLAFIKTSNSSFVYDYPDIEIVAGAGGLSGDLSGAMRRMVGITDEFYETVYKDIIGKPAFGLVPVLLRPFSRGRIMLKNRNPFHWPRMLPNFFTDQRDIVTLTKGIKSCINLANTKAFAKWNTRFNTRPFLGCEHFLFNSDSYWECCIRRHAGSLQHQVGTCKMGPPTDPNAVVNPRLQVYGIKNLRVVDSSIMPEIIAGHTNAASYMIGEKASDMIKEDWLNSVFK